MVCRTGFEPVTSSCQAWRFRLPQSLRVALPQLNGGVLSSHVALGLAMPSAVVTWLVTGHRCPSSPLRLPLTGPS